MDNNQTRWGAVRLFSGLLLGMSLVFGLALSPAMLSANTASAVYQPQPGPGIITIPAGGTATLTARGFCLDFGRPFPTGDTTTRDVAANRIRTALNYAIQKGYTEGNAPQVQLAIWYLRDNTWRAEQRVIAEEIVRESANAALPPTVAPTNAVSLAEAASQNRVNVVARFVPQTADAFYGDGTVQIRNLGVSEIRVYLPIGSVFTTGGTTFQDLAAYQISLQQGTTTPVATTTPATTLQPTSQPTLTAITTPVTGTVTTTTTPATTGTVVGTTTTTTTPTTTTTTTPTAVTTGTAVGTTTTTATVEATGTAATAVATTTPAGTTTTEATTTVEATSTVAATVEATATIGETPTAEPTATETIEVPTTEPTPTTQPTGGGTLPETGGQDGNLMLLMALVVSAGLALVGLGAALRRQRSIS